MTYESIDRSAQTKGIVKKAASYPKVKWDRAALNREVLFFGVSRTLPAVERKELSRFTNKNESFSDDRIKQSTLEAKTHIQRILGKDIDIYSVRRENSGVTLFAGKSDENLEYSEFHFGAGQSSVAKLVNEIENAPEQALILIEEIENGLHPVAISRLVDYLIGVAERKKAQVIFTTHSDYAIARLPAQAIWASVDGSVIQGKLDIQSLRSIRGAIEANLVIFTEDKFSKEWIESILSKKDNVAFDAIEVHAMQGDGTAIKVNDYHNLDPSANHVPSICFLDGDSRQLADSSKGVYKLPGQSPESYIYDKIVDKIGDCCSILAVRLGKKYEEHESIKELITSTRRTNVDPHLLFAQIGEKLGFTPEQTVRHAFFTTWCDLYPEVIDGILNDCCDKLPKLKTPISIS